MIMKRQDFVIWSKKVKSTRISDTRIFQYTVLDFLITHDYYNVVLQYKDTLYCKQLISSGHSVLHMYCKQLICTCPVLME